METYVYILHSDYFDRYYYGQTEDLNNRLEKHNSGSVASTKPYIPWKIYAYKKFANRSEAIVTERKIKNQKGRNRVSEFIKKHNFEILD